MTPLGGSNPRHCTSLAWSAVAVAALVSISVLAIVVSSNHGLPERSATLPESPATFVPSAITNSVSPTAQHTLLLSGSSAGSVVDTAFVNYNGTMPGNFPSLVWQWDASGGAVVDPVTDQLWIPEWPIPLSHVPTPTTAPALDFNPATNETQMVKALANTTSIAYDPIDKLLYATQAPSSAPGTVVTYNPTTGVVGKPVLVGYDPRAITYDPVAQNLFVANAASGNISVLNGSTGLKQTTIQSVGTDPVAFADDTENHFLFVANDGPYLGAYNVTAVNTTLNTVQTPHIFLTEPATSLAYSPSANLLAVGEPALTMMPIYHAASPQPLSGTANVGYNVTSVVSNSTGTEFIASNGTEPHLTIIPTTGLVYPTSPLPVHDIPSRLTLDGDNGLLYSWSNVNRTITTVNLSSFEAQQLSPDLGAEAASVAYDPESGNVFVADWGSHAISVLNASTFTTVRSPIAVQGIPTSLVDDALTSTIYVGYTGGVMALNASTGAILVSNTMPDLAGNNTQLVIDPESNLLWDLNKLTGLYALNIPSLTLQLATHVAAGTENLRGVALDNSSNGLFIVNRSNPAVPTLVEVNGTTGVPVGSPIGGIPGLLSVAYDSADHKIYALGQSVWIVNPNNRTIAAGPIPIAPHYVAWEIVYDPSREFLYVTSNSSLGLAWPGNVTVIDGSSVAASEGSFTSIPVGQLPIDLQPVQIPGSTAPGSSEIWVTNFISGTISIIANPPRITFFSRDAKPCRCRCPNDATARVQWRCGVLPNLLRRPARELFERRHHFSQLHARVRGRLYDQCDCRRLSRVQHGRNDGPFGFPGGTRQHSARIGFDGGDRSRPIPQCERLGYSEEQARTTLRGRSATLPRPGVRPSRTLTLRSEST